MLVDRVPPLADEILVCAHISNSAIPLAEEIRVTVILQQRNSSFVFFPITF